ncbi:MAG: nucleotidyltransferase family protein [Gemmatimonadaceae bacterium]
MSLPTLDKVLRAMHPTRNETLLLRALVLPDKRGADAWKQFGQAQGDLTELFRTDRGELRRLSPLLARSLKANGADVHARLWTVLRTASLREELRSKIYQQVLQEVVTTLGELSLPFAIFRGAAIGAQAYGDVSARHSHDIDVLINATDVAAAESALIAAGYVREPERELEAGQRAVKTLTHATSLPVRLHDSLFELNCYNVDTEFVLDSARPRNLKGIAAPVLLPEFILLQLLVHASYSTTRFTLQWVPDAFRVAAMVTSWEDFVSITLTSKLSLAVHSQLAYLERQIAPLTSAPELAALRDSARKASHAERDFALYGARVGSRAGSRSLFRALSLPGERLQLARWLALPSKEYLRWAIGALHQREGNRAAAERSQLLSRQQLLRQRLLRMLPI